MLPYRKSIPLAAKTSKAVRHTPPVFVIADERPEDPNNLLAAGRFTWKACLSRDEKHTDVLMDLPGMRWLSLAQ
jgi:hypothetical protein